MVKVTKWLMNLSPLQIGLILLLMPFLIGIVNGLISFISIFLHLNIDSNANGNIY